VSVVVWITGLPSSGKSTLAARVRARLGTHAVVLDGDEVRAALWPRPGYDDDGRTGFYRTLAGLAALLARQGHVVLVPATAHRRAWRDEARRAAPHFVEVWVRTPADECRRRDPKGLWRDAHGLPGKDVPYEEPTAADVVAESGQDDAAVEAVVAAARKACG
jgi:adenylylsulfate kinase